LPQVQTTRIIPALSSQETSPPLHSPEQRRNRAGHQDRPNQRYTKRATPCKNRETCCKKDAFRVAALRIVAMCAGPDWASTPQEYKRITEARCRRVRHREYWRSEQRMTVLDRGPTVRARGHRKGNRGRGAVPRRPWWERRVPGERRHPRLPGRAVGPFLVDGGSP